MTAHMTAAEWYLSDIEAHWPMDGNERMEAYAAYRVREALEEAAQIVEQEANDGANFRNFVIDPHWILHRIRALMPEGSHKEGRDHP